MKKKIFFLQHRKVYNISPKPPLDPALAGSKRLGLRKSPEISNRKLSPKAIFLYIYSIFLVCIFLNLHICFAQEDNFGAVKKLESVHFTVFYAPELDIQQLAKQLNIGIEEKIITGYRFSQEDLAAALDILFEQVCNILGMKMSDYKGTIKICSDDDKLAGIYLQLFDNDLGGMHSFYIDNINTIYISGDNFSKEIIGHEIAHAVISHYFVVKPPVKIQEILAGYVEYQLRKL